MKISLFILILFSAQLCWAQKLNGGESKERHCIESIKRSIDSLMVTEGYLEWGDSRPIISFNINIDSFNTIVAIEIIRVRNLNLSDDKLKTLLRNVDYYCLRGLISDAEIRPSGFMITYKNNYVGDQRSED